MDSYKRRTIQQLLEELNKKLKRLKKDTAEWIDTHARIENLKKDLNS